ncbi:MAG: YfcE family phosphodiesterase [Candidatus Izemoplasmatales bacterium]|nr:YfcE family phosphodiesterase [Candidatus Izemoplasmatales bacterium]
MKIILFSDNHRDKEAVLELIKMYPSADRYISLGDSEMTESELSMLNIYGVKGNYPFEPKFPDDLSFTFDDWDFFFTHGHKYGVKNGLSRLYEVSKSLNSEIVCFGHTHVAFLEEMDDIIFLNPGSLTFPKRFEPTSFAYIETSPNLIDIKILDLKTNKVIFSFKKKKR